MKGLQKASKTHAAQAKTLKGVLHGRSKSRNGKKGLRAQEGDYTQMKIQKILSELNLRLQAMRKRLLRRLKKFLSRMRGKFKS